MSSSEHEGPTAPLPAHFTIVRNLSPFGPVTTTLLGLAALVAACFGLVWLFGWAINLAGDRDFDRQATIPSFIADRGLNPNVRHAIIHIAHVDNGDVRVTLNAGNAGARTVEAVLPSGKINWAVGKRATVRFVYNANYVLFRDYKADNLRDRYSPNSGGKRGWVDTLRAYSLGELLVARDYPAALVAATVTLTPKLYHQVVKLGG